MPICLSGCWFIDVFLSHSWVTFPSFSTLLEHQEEKKNAYCIFYVHDCSFVELCLHGKISFVRTWWQRSENDFVEKSWKKCVSPGGLAILTKSWQILWHMLERKKNIGPRGELWGTPCNQWSGDLLSLIKSVMVVWQFKLVHGSHTLQTKRASVMPVGVIRF